MPLLSLLLQNDDAGSDGCKFAQERLKLAVTLFYKVTVYYMHAVCMERKGLSLSIKISWSPIILPLIYAYKA